MPGDAPREQLAAIARVTGDLDAVLDRLFANVAELKAILGGDGQSSAGDGESGGEQS